MRLGGHVFDTNSPEIWIKELKHNSYNAAYCPLVPEAEQNIIFEYSKAAKEADIIIAEVGVWNNPLASNEKERSAAIEKCKRSLLLAERIGANCCVNIAGTHSDRWDGPHPDNFTEYTFDLIIDTVRNIIDEIKPKNTYYTLETMPWMYPNSPDSYLRLIKAIDRPQFAVHLDIVNIIDTHEKYYRNDLFIKDCFSKLGKYTKSCHLKDTILDPQYTVHLNEVRPGLGEFNYPVFFNELRKAGPEIPCMLEHLPDQKEYSLAADHIRKVLRDMEIP